MRGQRLWCEKQAIEHGARRRVAVVEDATAGRLTTNFKAPCNTSSNRLAATSLQRKPRGKKKKFPEEKKTARIAAGIFYLFFTHFKLFLKLTLFFFQN